MQRSYHSIEIRTTVAVAAFFQLNGQTFASLVAHIPTLQQRAGLSVGQLGLALLGMPLGLMVGVGLGTFLVKKRGSHLVTFWSAVVYCAAIPLPALSPSFCTLMLSLALVGLANGALDVGMNLQSTALEVRSRRASSLAYQAVFSVGTPLGAGIGALVVARGIDILPHLVVVGAVGVIMAILARPHLVIERVDPHPPLARPKRPLAMLGAVSFAALFTAGAVADWSALYIQSMTASTGRIGLGYALFSVMELLGRAGGFLLSGLVNATLIGRSGGLIAACGAVLVVFPGKVDMVLAGFALMGLGLSCIFPLALSAARYTSLGRAPEAVATVTTCGYSGFFAGPPLIGFIAEMVSLRAGMALTLLLIVVIVLLASSLRFAGGRDTSADRGA